MNTVDLLLKMDAGTITEIPTGEMEIPRLSKLTGERFVIAYKALPGRRIMELSDGVIKSNGQVNAAKGYDINLLLVCEGMTSPDLKSKDLQKHFGAASPKDLADKLFIGGEVSKIAEAVMAVSGYGKDKDGNETDEAIKN